MIHILFIKPLICHSSLVRCTEASAFVMFLHSLYSGFPFDLSNLCIAKGSACIRERYAEGTADSQADQRRRERTTTITETILIGNS